MLPLLTFGLSLALVIIHSIFMKGPRTAKKLLEITFIYIMAVNIGLGGIMAFFGHVFNGPQIASMIGWPAGSPFQYEVGVADLAFGTIAILIIWIRGDFWLAAALANAIFLIGCGAGHLRDIMQNGNMAAYNAGPTLYLTDFAIPLLVLMIAIIIPMMKDTKKTATIRRKRKK